MLPRQYQIETITLTTSLETTQSPPNGARCTFRRFRNLDDFMNESSSVSVWSTTTVKKCDSRSLTCMSSSRLRTPSASETATWSCSFVIALCESQRPICALSVTLSFRECGGVRMMASGVSSKFMVVIAVAHAVEPRRQRQHSIQTAVVFRDDLSTGRSFFRSSPPSSTSYLRFSARRFVQTSAPIPDNTNDKFAPPRCDIRGTAQNHARQHIAPQKAPIAEETGQNDVSFV